MTASSPAPSKFRPMVWLLTGVIHIYRLTLSPFVGWHCRFQPTCSHYALEALSRHGAARGAWLTLRRLARCHPWGGWGFDPVPPAKGEDVTGAERRDETTIQRMP